MKFDTVTDYPYTADVWQVVSQDPDSGIAVYGFYKPIRCQFTTYQSRTMIRTDEILGDFMQIRSIKDADGIEIAPGTKYVIKAMIPVVNVFGYAEGLSYLLGTDRTVPV